MDVDSNFGQAVVSNLSNISTSFLSQEAMDVDP